MPGARGPKRWRGPKVTRIMYQDCYYAVYRYFTKSSPLPTYTLPFRTGRYLFRNLFLFLWFRSYSDVIIGGLGPVANVCCVGGGKNYGYATGVELRRLPRDRKIAGLYRRRCTANARRRLVGASFCASLPCRDLRWQLWCVRLYTCRVTVT